MSKSFHEIRDPIHVFVRLSSEERRVLDSRPFQRLRHIHQLALTYLVYPGATHRRFEHSLGVMELASRVFDVITRQENLEKVQDLIPEIKERYKVEYWRRVLRMAALCHDIGHLPFSHAAEKELLPVGWTHENLSDSLIQDKEMRDIWDDMKIKPVDVAKLALGPEEAPKLSFSTLETILSEIIVGDAFGVDRMDYLLRDSHHLGVAYGKFDHYRLVDTLRILHVPPSDPSGATGELALGIEQGGLESAEALMLARYFMYSQVYFHPIRRIYDIHLKDFLKEWLPDGKYPIDVKEHLKITDNEVNAALYKAATDDESELRNLARRIVNRKHFKVVYERNPNDVRINPNSAEQIFVGLRDEFGTDLIRRDFYSQKSGAPDFPVKMRDAEIVSSLAISKVLADLPVVSVDYIYSSPEIESTAKNWLIGNREALINTDKRGNGDG